MNSNLRPIRLFILLPKALLVEWKGEPSFLMIKKLVLLKRALVKDAQVERITLAYNSLLLQLSKKIESKDFWRERIEQLETEISKNNFEIGSHWVIPVCYEKDYAPDLIAAAHTLNLKTDDLIELHSQTSYVVNFIGFLPGFLYLSGLDKRLHLPRKEKPTLIVPSSSIGIGGNQTGIYPQESPGGWHLIGKTPYLFLILIIALLASLQLVIP